MTEEGRAGTNKQHQLEGICILDKNMTTFTRIAEEDTPSISVDISRRLSKIGRSIRPFLPGRIYFFKQLLTPRTDPNIYGGFTECVSCFLHCFLQVHIKPTVNSWAIHCLLLEAECFHTIISGYSNFNDT